MKFGGTSVADAERIKRAARRIVAAAPRRGATRWPCCRRAASTPTSWWRSRTRSPERPHPREMDMLLSTGERVTCALAAMVINDLGHEAISLTGSQAGIVTDSGPHEGAHPRGEGPPHPRGARRRQDRPGRGLPGRLAELARRDHARPRRLGHHRRRPRRRARRRGLRDLHRRRRRVQRRPAHRARGPQAAGAHLRGDARDVGRPARACCSCARSSTRATTASRSTADPASTTDPVPWSRTRSRPWNDRL